MRGRSPQAKRKKTMTRKIITILLLIQIPIFMAAQNDETFEIQADKVDSNSNIEIQKFYEKFNSWIERIGKDSTNIEMDEKTMVNNFIIFSEDGLIMKDLDFHSVESCKKQILENIPNGEKESKWIYVTMESHVNKNELIKVLKFLSVQKIDYQFGKEDEFVPKIMKK